MMINIILCGYLSVRWDYYMTIFLYDNENNLYH